MTLFRTSTSCFTFFYDIVSEPSLQIDHIAGQNEGVGSITIFCNMQCRKPLTITHRCVIIILVNVSAFIQI